MAQQNTRPHWRSARATFHRRRRAAALDVGSEDKQFVVGQTQPARIPLDPVAARPLLRRPVCHRARRQAVGLLRRPAVQHRQGNHRLRRDQPRRHSLANHPRPRAAIPSLLSLHLSRRRRAVHGPRERRRRHRSAISLRAISGCLEAGEGFCCARLRSTRRCGSRMGCTGSS